MTDYIQDFKNKSLSYRKKLSGNLLNKHPDRVCVIVERDLRCKNIPKTIKHKYLVPISTTVGTFSNVLRSKIELPEYESFYVTFNNIIVSRHFLMCDAYKNYADEDGFLYCRYCSEQTYG
jgi:microtubule-associated protein 1 light chain